MIRRILGFALFAVVVWLVLQIAVALLGTLIGLATTVLVLAGLGYACHLVLRVISPATAAKVRDAIRGRPANVGKSGRHDVNSSGRTFAVTALLWSASAGSLLGQSHLPAVDLFVYGGGYSTVHKAFNLTTGTTDDFKTGFGLGGGVGLEIHKYLEVRATLTGAQSHLRVNGAETGGYLNRYYVGADIKGRYALPSGVTPYGLAGGGVVILREKGTSAGSKAQGFGHLGVGVAYAIWGHWSLFAQGDGFFYSLSGLASPALRAYSSAQFDIGWSVGASFRL